MARLRIARQPESLGSRDGLGALQKKLRLERYDGSSRNWERKGASIEGFLVQRVSANGHLAVENGLIAKEIVADTAFDNSPVFVKAASLADGMPGTHVFQLGHHVDQLLHEHGG